MSSACRCSWGPSSTSYHKKCNSYIPVGSRELEQFAVCYVSAALALQAPFPPSFYSIADTRNAKEWPKKTSCERICQLSTLFRARQIRKSPRARREIYVRLLRMLKMRKHEICAGTERSSAEEKTTHCEAQHHRTDSIISQRPPELALASLGTCQRNLVPPWGRNFLDTVQHFGLRTRCVVNP